LAGSLSLRASRRLLHAHHRKSAGVAGQPPKRVLLYGAGRAGQLLVRELETNCEIEVVGFVDDDPSKAGTVIARTRVLGNGDDLAHVAQLYHIDEVIVSMATPGHRVLARVVAKCRKANVPCKIIPSVTEILSGNVPINQLREIRTEEVLGRESVEVAQFEELAGWAYQGKRILVTGAGGSIGSELVRQLVRLNPSKLAIVDKDENSVYELEQELSRRGFEYIIEARVADIRKRSRADAIFSAFRPQFVFHAAAHKHVPLMEKDPCEAVLNNVVGTRNVMELAVEYGAERFVFISTDKAVNPASVMGATKRIGELLIQGAAHRGSTRVACVRFGNVLGSRGSVVPLFQKQIAEGGPVTVTHPEIVRYFMTVQEAVQLILCAGTLANGGEIFVLEMGTPRNILELARELIVLAGLEPEKDILTTFTGLRPGEKLYEDLVGPTEKLSPTPIDKIHLIQPEPFDEGSFLCDVEELVETARSNDASKVYDILRRMDLGFIRKAMKARAAGAHS
jgi:FlaA1/EpsC-like NDP-sugar epimerase